MHEDPFLSERVIINEGNARKPLLPENVLANEGNTRSTDMHEIYMNVNRVNFRIKALIALEVDDPEDFFSV